MHIRYFDGIRPGDFVYYDKVGKVQVVSVDDMLDSPSPKYQFRSSDSFFTIMAVNEFIDVTFEGEVVDNLSNSKFGFCGDSSKQVVFWDENKSYIPPALEEVLEERLLHKKGTKDRIERELHDLLGVPVELGKLQDPVFTGMNYTFEITSSKYYIEICVLKVPKVCKSDKRLYYVTEVNVTPN